jgi:hypothetical protein
MKNSFYKIWFILSIVCWIAIILIGYANSQEPNSVPSAGTAIEQCEDCYLRCYPRAFHTINDWHTCICIGE